MIGSDLEEATNIATLMAASYGLGSFLRLDTPLTSVSVNFRPSPAIAADVESILKREYEAAKELLLIVEKDVRSLAGILATDKRLTLQSREVLESFKDRRP